MASITMKELQEKDVATLRGHIADWKRELMNLRFQKVSGELSNTSRFREVRVNIARAYTALNKADAN
jgi:large subunit ribosomal protein L29